MMHGTSIDIMQKMINTHLVPAAGEGQYFILDVGSMDINGSYKPLLVKPNWVYQGLDLEPGPNVNIVASSQYKWPIESRTFNAVVSGQCLEHVRAPWLWIDEVVRVCKKRGLVVLIAPWKFFIHQHPVDCWRILPDGMAYLMDYAGLEVLEVGHNDCGAYGDCWGVGRKLIE